MLREMTTTYGRHPGGYIWAILEPVLALALLTLVFSIAFRSPAIGDNFALFYATGYLPYMLYNDICNKISSSLRYSKQLLQYPKITFLDAIIARLLLNSIVHLVVFIIIISSIRYYFETGRTLELGSILNSLVLAISLGLGIGTLNCYVSTRFPVWERIWAILNRPMFIISGIFFLFENVPDSFRDILWYNPLIHIIGIMRTGFYPIYDASYASTFYIFSWALISLYFGILLLFKYNRDLLNSI